MRGDWLRKSHEVEGNKVRDGSMEQNEIWERKRVRKARGGDLRELNNGRDRNDIA